MKLVILGLSITSSWGNGHATTYRALVREFSRRGHEVLFLERDVPWYASNRDLTDHPYLEIALYASLDELDSGYRNAVSEADAVMVGSYVPEGIAAGDWALQHANGLVGFYDIDTPVTLAQLEKGKCEYLSAEQIALYDIYLSFTGGPTLKRLEKSYGSPCAKPFHCSVDTEIYYPEDLPERWDLGYLGTYSDDRQPGVNRLLMEPARQWPKGRFVVAGPQYPEALEWPRNVKHIPHLPPAEHREFYNSQRFTLNITREDMIAAGYSPSVRLFEAAACGVPIISDYWEGLEDFFSIGSEILVAQSTQEMISILQDISPDQLREIGHAARTRILAEHTAVHRAAQLEDYLIKLAANQSILI